ncbi:MAG: NAD-dependent epimerase/dehydratase family protein [Bacilli bacterium]|jgi:UDP-glucose 4-epimerase
MKAIVTGANGFVGSSLIKKLIANNIEVLAIDISFANSKLPKSDLIFKKEVSIENIQELAQEMNNRDYEFFYHFAWVGVNGPDKGNIDVQLQNIKMALLCAKVAKKLDCKKFLCAGTIAERNIESLPNLKKAGPGMFYGSAKHATHLLLETYCKNVGLNFIWMQFSNIYGPNNKTGNLISYTISQLQKNETASFGPARQPYDFIFVDDLIEAVYRLGIKETKQNFYFIGSGTPMILADYLIKVGYVFGKPELIKIGEKEDDGIKYSFNMLDNTNLVNDIGNYISGSFDELIHFTIQNY